MVVPAPKLGEVVKSLPGDVGQAYEEARSCTSAGAYTAAVMLCRKILMHVAVEKKADKNQSYAHYVNYLEAKGYVPPDGKQWVDRIRDLGNDANHDLPRSTQEDALDALEFTGQLLKFVYELPARVPRKKKEPAADPTKAKK